MKRLLSPAFWLVLSLVLFGMALAQTAAQTITQIVGTDWGKVGADVGALGVVTGLLIHLAGRLLPNLIKGPVKYFAATGLSVVIGIILDLTHILTNPQVAGLPTPLAGIVYGLIAAAGSVFLHQGTKQTGQAFKNSATTRLQ